MPLIESVIIIIALLSIMPRFFGFHPLWYDGWLVVVLAAMVWITVRRLARTREAADEARRKHDEATKTGRPPWLR